MAIPVRQGEVELIDTSKMKRAIQTVVSYSIKDTITEQPQEFVDVLQPILLPAIRRSIVNYFNELVRDLQKTLEYSLSFQSIRWRIEAMRTGRPFSEVVLLHSLIYQVDEILLIDHESGLLIDRAGISEASIGEPEVVSGMVTALGDFIRDSFRTPFAPSSGTLQYDEYTVWTERGRSVTLAAFIRGNPPSELRQKLSKALLEFQQNPSTTTAAAEFLIPCLSREFKPKPPKAKIWRYLAIFFVTLPVIAFFIFVGTTIQRQFQLIKYTNVVKSISGVVIYDAKYSLGKFQLEGLRDSYSENPALVLKKAGLDPQRVKLDLQPFISLEPAVLSARVHALLKAPDSVQVEAGENGIRILGYAPYQWVQKTKENLADLTSWVSFDSTNLLDEEALQLEAIKSRTDSTLVEFSTGSSHLSPRALTQIDQVVENLQKVSQLANATQRDWKVVIRGSADATGPVWRNKQLGSERARAVKRRLVSNGIPNGKLKIKGIDASADVGRRVLFDVSWFPKERKRKNGT